MPLNILAAQLMSLFTSIVVNFKPGVPDVLWFLERIIRRYAYATYPKNWMLIQDIQLKQARKEGRLAEAMLDRRAKLKRYADNENQVVAPSLSPLQRPILLIRRM